MLTNKSYAQVRSQVWISYGLKNILDPFSCMIVLRSHSTCTSHVMMRNPFRRADRLLLAAFLITHEASEPMAVLMHTVMKAAFVHIFTITRTYKQMLLATHLT